MVNVSQRSIASSKKVLNEGAPQLFQAIERGHVKASVAEKLLVLSKDKQAEAIPWPRCAAAAILAKQAMRELTEKRLGDKTRALPAEQLERGVCGSRLAVRGVQPGDRPRPRGDNHYPTQTTDDICKLPVVTVSAPDCVLFLWATAPMLPDALRVMRFWGFAYKTCFSWDKVTAGTGYWNRNRHKLLLRSVPRATSPPRPPAPSGTASSSLGLAGIRKSRSRPMN